MAEYANKGVAGTALGLGIGSVAAQVLSGGLGGLFGGGMVCSENMAVNRFELNQEKALAEKNAEIAYLKGQNETNEKLTAVYANLEGQIKALESKVQANKDEQYGVNLQQAVYNGTNTAAIGCIKDQVAQLASLTKLVVPNTSVCPGWGDVTVSIPTTTAGA